MSQRTSDRGGKKAEQISWDDDQSGEGGPNWRILRLFSPPEDADLSRYINVPRPQSDIGRYYPSSRSSTEKKSGGVGVSRPLTPIMGRPLKSNSRGYVLPNGRTWVRHRSNNEIPLDETVIPSTSSTAITPDRRHLSTTPMTTGKRKNLSLRIINGQKIYGDNRECFQYIENGSCLAGPFCPFEHAGSAQHQAKDLCTRYMSGQCRFEDGSCSAGEHNLLPHQMPVCHYFLRMICSRLDCCYLHVKTAPFKHTDGLEPCADFNRGVCQRGIMCDRPHRYYYARIKERTQATGLPPNGDNGVSARREEPEQVTTPPAEDTSTYPWFC